MIWEALGYGVVVGLFAGYQIGWARGYMKRHIEWKQDWEYFR